MELNKLERYWLIAVGVVLGAFTAATIVALLFFNIRLPSPVERIDPQRLEETEFARPGIRRLTGSRYEAYIVAKSWAFEVGPDAGTPPTLRFPAGSEVTFYVTSKDVMHGFQIEGHTANLELVPGQIARTTARFNRPGRYNIICNHYCGAGHHLMYATILVE
ncbi:MAG: cytochrome c oxidase subunit II [Anaerolineae bacterium]|nr:cytochrome c oxidase subunit II [Thermoflexales bacterium]MDW8395310.1 cytochrome c oxidase subunit II [Anaerolineae bacterium]